MESISAHVGMRIKQCRKKKNMTIEELGRVINKSKATISKYENGSVAIDIETLEKISSALDVNIISLVDYDISDENVQTDEQNIYFNQSKIYMYYYDGRNGKIMRTLICKLPSLEPNTQHTKVIMYQGIESFETPERAQHVFIGEMIPYDTITHFFLTNQVNNTEKMYVCIFNPLHANSQAIGMLSGIASNPFFGPIALKVLASKEMIEENDALMNVIRLQPLEHQVVENLNMMFINRPNSLFLATKKDFQPQEN